MQRKIIVNGREYRSVDEMPEEIRLAYQSALAQLPDVNGNGIPDVLEQGGNAEVVSTRRASISFNGRTVDTEGAVPAVLHRMFDAAAAQANAGRDDTSVSARAASHAPGPRDRTRGALVDVMWILLGVAAAFVLTVAILMIASMDASSRSQGGRIYVVVAAIAVLGAIDSQALRVAKRRWGTLLGTSAMERRFALWSTVALLLASGVLVAVAMFLP